MGAGGLAATGAFLGGAFLGGVFFAMGALGSPPLIAMKMPPAAPASTATATTVRTVLFFFSGAAGAEGAAGSGWGAAGVAAGAAAGARASITGGGDAEVCSARGLAMAVFPAVIGCGLGSGVGASAAAMLVSGAMVSSKPAVFSARSSATAARLGRESPVRSRAMGSMTGSESPVCSSPVTSASPGKKVCSTAETALPMVLPSRFVPPAAPISGATWAGAVLGRPRSSLSSASRSSRTLA